MGGPYDESAPAELQGIAARLREERLEVDALQLDRVKQRALARSSSRSGRRTMFTARLAAMITTFVLACGCGGALALARFDSHPNIHGGAASDQYGHGKGCGHKHPKPPPPRRGCKPKTSVSGASTTTSGTTPSSGTGAAASTEGATTAAPGTAGTTAATNSNASQGSLPFTGQNVLTVALVGLLLAGAGLLLLESRSRKRGEH